METNLKTLNVSDGLRGTGLDPVRAATALSLMLLWSQRPASKLDDLPSFKDVSAEYVLAHPLKIATSLHEEDTRAVAHVLAELRPSELENLRRLVINALDADHPASDIAEAILAYCAPEAWATKELSDLLLAILDAKKGEQILCAFSYVTRPAWILSKQANVDLGVENKDWVSVISMLGEACSRALKVRWRSISSLAGDFILNDGFDHALIAPPIGIRQKVGTIGDNVSTEILGARRAAHTGRWRSVVVVGNGLLFRTSSKDAAFKQELLYNYGLEAVVSLPRGGWPGSAIAVSALVFSGEEGRQPRQALRFIDASEPAPFDTRTLRKLLSGDGRDPRCVDRSFAELAEASFNLSVDRYVLDANSRRNLELLERCQTVKLSDIADIRRPQALPRDSRKQSDVTFREPQIAYIENARLTLPSNLSKPPRSSATSIGSAVFTVREAQLADIKNGRLNLPSKLSELPRSAMTKIESAILKPGDILLSIKGTIGKTALVTEQVIADSNLVPIVPGQSLVIIRLRKGSVIRDPQVLIGYLRSPVAQSLLQATAGGTTIANVAMGELKQLSVPIPSAETQAKIVAEHEEWAKLQTEIDQLKDKMKATEENIARLVVGLNGGAPV